jgi:hypothetical protein
MSRVIQDPDTGESFLVLGDARFPFATVSEMIHHIPFIGFFYSWLMNCLVYYPQLGQINEKMRDPTVGINK